MAHQLIPSTLLKMLNRKHLRRFLAGRVDRRIYKSIVKDASDDLKQVQLRKYRFLSAMLSCMLRNIDKGYIGADIAKNIVNVFVLNSLTWENQSVTSAMEEFREKYGEYPPSFIVLSPTQKCNLKCRDCYASSAADSVATLDYNVVERIVGEVHDIFGGRFVTISGGEPFVYESGGKTLFDIFEKYRDMFFLVYTNGIPITDEVAERLGRAGNVTPAISVEGFEEETDARRGSGVHGKILDVFERLRNTGVPFGVSVTATRRNVDVLLSDEFYDFYFEKEGVTYMWQFQLMPIGRGKDEMDSMVEPAKRVELYRKWEKMLVEKKYCVADFWNSGVLSRGCIAYSRGGGYAYIDWHGNVTPCVFIPYYVDNVYEMYQNGKTLADALFSDFMKNGRKWQKEYGLADSKKPHNWLMPCSIRDHYEIFRKSILTGDAKPEDTKAKEAIESDEYFDILKKYDDDLAKLTEKIWEDEFLNA